MSLSKVGNDDIISIIQCDLFICFKVFVFLDTWNYSKEIYKNRLYVVRRYPVQLFFLIKKHKAGKSQNEILTQLLLYNIDVRI